MQHRLVDYTGRVVPHDGDSVGELQVRGPWITRAYYSPDHNGGAPDDSHFSDGWLRTGDIGTITLDGYLTLVDRAKDVIKSGGEWISSVDLENGVMSHRDVVEASGFGVPDDKWDERPCVAVVLRDGASTDAEALRAHLASSFAKWQLPERWVFIAKGAQDERREVRQAGAAPAVRRRAGRDGHRMSVLDSYRLDGRATVLGGASSRLGIDFAVALAVACFLPP